MLTLSTGSLKNLSVKIQNNILGLVFFLKKINKHVKDIVRTK